MTQLKTHEIWQFVPGAESLETFQNRIIPELYLKKEVSQEIHSEMEIVRKLLIHSYFEYEFIDIATVQAVFCLEKALKLRFHQINNTQWKGNFDSLLNWFFNNNYFETENPKVYDQLRLIRNGKVHDVKKTLGGLVFLGKIQNPIHLINDSYEDPALRKTRKLYTLEVNKKVRTFLWEGGILHYRNQSYIITGAHIVLINTKSSSPIFHLFTLPIYDLEPYKKGRLIIQTPINIDLQNLEFYTDHIGGMDSTGNKIRITKIDEKNFNRFNTWNEDLHSLNNPKSIMQLVEIPMNDYLLKSLVQFHKTQ